MNHNIFTTDEWKSKFPQKIFLMNDSGAHTLDLCDTENNFPKLQIAYHHSTPEITGDVLSDGEPDYLGIDIHIHEESDDAHTNVDITYGDAMMFSFKIKPPNNLKVGHYNGYGSKFDSESEFHFEEESINDLINFFNQISPSYKLTRNKFNFLDGDKNSFKMEKVRWISDFRKFNLLNRP